ncbi:MAG: tetratricopeptide repeat protein [Pseudomonadota bacterium]
MNTKWWHLAAFVVIVLSVAILLHPTKYRAGWMHLRGGELRKAIDELRQVYKENQRNYRAIKYLAQALEQKGNYDEAGGYLDKLLELKPREDHYKEAVRFYTWNLMPQKAKLTYRKWLDYRRARGKSFDDEDGERMVNDLYAYYLMDQEYKDAIDMLKIRQEIDDENRESLDNDLITLHEYIGDMDATLAILEKVLERNVKNTYALEKFMRLAAFSGKQDLAEKYLAQNIKENPDNDESWERMIRFASAERKDYERADKWYTKWLERKPEDANLMKKYINWLMGTDQQKKAITYMEKNDMQDMKDDYFKKTLEDLYIWNNVKPKLLVIYQERFKKNPHDKENADNLLALLIEFKKFDEAKEVLQRLATIYPKIYAQQLVDLYDLQDDDASAIAALEKAVHRSGDPELLKRLGERYLWSTPKAKAKKQTLDSSEQSDKLQQ